MIHWEARALSGGEARRDTSDKQLLERFVTDRDQAAFTGLVDRHGRTVWGVCRRLLPQEQDAEDAFQAVFLLLARRATSIRKSESVGSWLYGVAYRIATRAGRMAARRQECERQARSRSVDRAPWSEAAFREMQRLLDDEVQRLSEKYRAPFVLCCLEGMSRAEAARELGCKEGTLSARLARARKLLQSRLARRGITLSAVLTATALSQGTAQAMPVAAFVQGTINAALAPGTSAAVSPASLTLADGTCRALAVAKLTTALTPVLALSAILAATALAGFSPAPVADNTVWAPRPFPPGWAEEHGEGAADEIAMLADLPAGKLAAQGARLKQDRQLDAVPSHKGEYPARFRRSFQQLAEIGTDLELFGLDPDQGVRCEPAGLRIVLPPGYPDERPRTGIATTFGLQGDFDVAVSYDILQEPDAADTEKQTRLTLALPLNTPSQHFATLSRTIMPGKGASFLAMLTQRGRDSRPDVQYHNAHSARAKSGRLRLVRTGSSLFFYVADGRDGNYVLVDQAPFDGADVREVRIVGSTGGIKAGLDVRITDLQIDADSFGTGRPAGVESPGIRPWLARALALVLLLLLTWGFGVNITRRRQSGKIRPDAVAAAKKLSSAPSESFTCSRCGRDIRPDSVVADEKAACPHCGKAVSGPMSPATQLSPSSLRRRLLLATSLAFFGVSLVCAYLLYVRSDTRSTAETDPNAVVPPLTERHGPATRHLNRPFGAEAVPGIEERGLWHTEFTKPTQHNNFTKEPFRWTNGTARLVVPLSDGAPQSMKIRLGVPIPRPVERLWIKVNGESLFDEAVNMPYEWSHTFDLSNIAIGRQAVIEIISDSFPAGDGRILGVCVRSITLVRNPSN